MSSIERESTSETEVAKLRARATKNPGRVEEGAESTLEFLAEAWGNPLTWPLLLALPVKGIAAAVRRTRGHFAQKELRRRGEPVHEPVRSDIEPTNPDRRNNTPPAGHSGPATGMYSRSASSRR